jgi:hypothetical protein
VDSIGRLPERQREAIVAHEFEGRSYEEIAHTMSATTPIVRQLVHRARTRLRDACGVLVPGWALRWLTVADLRTAGSERAGEAVAGGAAGAGLLKAGTAVLATGAIATGAGGLVVKPDHFPGSRHAASPRAQSQVPAAPDRESSATPLQSSLRAGHIKRVGNGKPRGKGGQDGHHRGTQGPSHAQGGDRSEGHAQRPHHDGAAEQDASGDSSPADSHKASHDGSGDRHGDGSPGAGHPGDGSGDSRGKPDGPEPVEGSGVPDSPPSPPPPTEP